MKSYLRAISEIATNTFKETVRNNVLYLVLFFVVALIVLSVFVADWSVFARIQVMQDFGLATMSLAGLLLAVFIGVGMLGREISQKTVYHVITKPVSRNQFVCGKFAGLLFTLLINYFVMSIIFIGTLIYLGGTVQLTLIYAIFLIWAEMSLMISASIFFSTLTTPMLASIFSLAFYIAGHFNDLLSIKFVEAKGSLYPVLLKVIYFVLPNLEHFNVRDNIVYNINLPTAYYGYAVVYGILYTALFLTLSCALFSKKDL
ncbi:MAG TPA: ABC transporter permease [Chitinivibrionales bacterium]|nr:ABC transporter permease [Chitinivibrionales bacterium]